MSIEQSKVVDVISTDPRTGHVVLTISDHLDWSNSTDHQRILQSKLNSYLAFVESGEILVLYPGARNRPVTLKVAFKFRPDQQGLEFLSRARQVVESAGFSLRYEVLGEN